MHFRRISFLAATLMLVLTGPALASEAEALAKQKRCFSCHDVNAENHGPSFKAIARKFSASKDARALLIREVQTGTATAGALHHWGNMKMQKDSDRVPVSAAEAEQLVDYILGTK